MYAKKIIFTSDILRLTPNLQSRDKWSKNTHWLLHVLRTPIQYASRLPIEVLEWNTTTDFDGEKVFARFGQQADVDGWISLYYQKTIPDAVIEYFEPLLSNSIVMGFEIPPYLMKICDALSVPCIGIMWDPIRFMDDVFFSFNTNHPAVFEQLSFYQLPNFQIEQAVNFHRARHYRKGTSIELDGTLILGQSGIFPALIENQKIKVLADAAPQIRTLSSEGAVWFKKHPFDLSTAHSIENLNRLGIQLLEQDYNTYDLFCASKLKKITALSSGAVIEARFFGKEAYTFVKPYYQHYQALSAHTTQARISVFSAFHQVNFWANILRPVLEKVYEAKDQLPFKANRFMDDVFFSFNTNHPAVFEQLSFYQLPNFQIEQAVNFHRARHYRKGTSIELDGTLILGQSGIFPALIENQKIKVLADAAPQIRTLSSEGAVWFKKHPFDLSTAHSIENLNRLGIQLLEQDYNTYDLFCASKLKKITALSSGAVIEARFFGKEAYTFVKPYYQHYQALSAHTTQARISVFSAFHQVNFWANILRPVLEKVYEAKDQLPFKANRLRHANCSFWGYEEPKDEQLIINYEQK
ncbi:MAG: hypothetical protein AAFP82_05835 [Bacteroidota bacterium]